MEQIRVSSCNVALQITYNLHLLKSHNLHLLKSHNLHLLKSLTTDTYNKTYILIAGVRNVVDVIIFHFWGKDVYSFLCMGKWCKIW